MDEQELNLDLEDDGVEAVHDASNAGRDLEPEFDRDRPILETLYRAGVWKKGTTNSVALARLLVGNPRIGYTLNQALPRAGDDEDVVQKSYSDLSGRHRQRIRHALCEFITSTTRLALKGMSDSFIEEATFDALEHSLHKRRKVEVSLTSIERLKSMDNLTAGIRAVLSKNGKYSSLERRTIFALLSRLNKKQFTYEISAQMEGFGRTRVDRWMNRARFDYESLVYEKELQPISYRIEKKPENVVNACVDFLLEDKNVRPIATGIKLLLVDGASKVIPSVTRRYGKAELYRGYLKHIGVKGDDNQPDDTVQNKYLAKVRGVNWENAEERRVIQAMGSQIRARYYLKKQSFYDVVSSITSSQQRQAKGADSKIFENLHLALHQLRKTINALDDKYKAFSQVPQAEEKEQSLTPELFSSWLRDIEELNKRSYRSNHAVDNIPRSQEELDVLTTPEGVAERCLTHCAAHAVCEAKAMRGDVVCSPETVCPRCALPFETLKSIEVLAEKIREDHPNAYKHLLEVLLPQFKDGFVYLMGHLLRCRVQEMRSAELLRDLAPNKAYLIMDYKQKFKPERGFEDQHLFFQKSGSIQYHGTAVIVVKDESKPHLIAGDRLSFSNLMRSGRYEVRFVDHIMYGNVDLPASLTLAIIERVFRRVKVIYPHVDTCIIQSDNAGQYKTAGTKILSLLFYMTTGVKIERFLHNEPQNGKTLLDRHFGEVTVKVRRYLCGGADEDRAVVLSTDLIEALEGLRNTHLVVLGFGVDFTREVAALREGVSVYPRSAVPQLSEEEQKVLDDKLPSEAGFLLARAKQLADIINKYRGTCEAHGLFEHISKLNKATLDREYGKVAQIREVEFIWPEMASRTTVPESLIVRTYRHGLDFRTRKEFDVMTLPLMKVVWTELAADVYETQGTLTGAREEQVLSPHYIQSFIGRDAPAYTQSASLDKSILDKRKERIGEYTLCARCHEYTISPHNGTCDEYRDTTVLGHARRHAYDIMRKRWDVSIDYRILADEGAVNASEEEINEAPPLRRSQRASRVDYRRMINGMDIEEVEEGEENVAVVEDAAAAAAARVNADRDRNREHRYSVSRVGLGDINLRHMNINNMLSIFQRGWADHPGSRISPLAFEFFVWVKSGEYFMRHAKLRHHDLLEEVLRATRFNFPLFAPRGMVGVSTLANRCLKASKEWLKHRIQFSSYLSEDGVGLDVDASAELYESLGEEPYNPVAKEALRREAWYRGIEVAKQARGDTKASLWSKIVAWQQERSDRIVAAHVRNNGDNGVSIFLSSSAALEVPWYDMKTCVLEYECRRRGIEIKSTNHEKMVRKLLVFHEVEPEQIQLRIQAMSITKRERIQDELKSGERYISYEKSLNEYWLARDIKDGVAIVSQPVPPPPQGNQGAPQAGAAAVPAAEVDVGVSVDPDGSENAPQEAAIQIDEEPANVIEMIEEEADDDGGVAGEGLSEDENDSTENDPEDDTIHAVIDDDWD